MAPATPATAVAFDYSKPIGVTDNPPEPGAVDTAQETLAKARESFKANDYSRALALTDQALVTTPNDPILHEFRALVLFALKRYEEAAATAYAVLTAGPGWNWATMVGLYPDLDTYSSQLRELEANVRQNPNSASGHFLLAYHYMVQGHKDSAASEFQNVVKLEPKDQLAARFAAALGATAPEPPKLPAQLAQASDSDVAKPVDLAQTGGGDTPQARTAGESGASAGSAPAASSAPESSRAMVGQAQRQDHHRPVPQTGWYVRLDRDPGRKEPDARGVGGLSGSDPDSRAGAGPAPGGEAHGRSRRESICVQARRAHPSRSLGCRSRRRLPHRHRRAEAESPKRARKKPVASNDTPEGRAKNDRIELSLEKA